MFFSAQDKVFWVFNNFYQTNVIVNMYVEWTEGNLEYNKNEFTENF